MFLPVVLLLLLQRNQPEHAWKRRKFPSVSTRSGSAPMNLPPSVGGPLTFANICVDPAWRLNPTPSCRSGVAMRWPVYCTARWGSNVAASRFLPRP